MEFRDYAGSSITLSDESWEHIQKDHPEVTRNEIAVTLAEPVEVRRSKRRPDVVRLYYRQRQGAKTRLSVVVVKFCSDGNFVSTGYTTDKMKDGETIYKREEDAP